MRLARVVHLVNVHCEGEVGKVLVGGVVDVPGATMLDKMIHLNTVDDSLRRFTVFEPRGAVNQTVNLLLPPVRPEAHAGFIVLQPDEAHPMSGSNAICVATCLLETGVVAMQEPDTKVVLDTPAGLVTIHAQCRDGRCERASVDMVPSFVERLDVPVDTPRWGRVRGDVAYGGAYYALVDVHQVGLAIEPAAARDLVTAGMALKDAFDRAVDVRHPELPAIDHISYVMFRDREPDGTVRTCTILRPGRVDRSPCGTGSSANLATMHARGSIHPGERTRSRSIIGSEFEVLLTATTNVAGRPAVLPRVSGRAWIYGFEQMAFDPADPFPQGFAVADTWGPEVESIARRAK